MRAIPVRVLLGAAVGVLFAGAPVAADAGSSSAAVVGPLKACTYSTGDVTEGSSTLIVKVVAVGGGGVRGTMHVKGTGLDRTVPFRLKKGGIGLVAIPLSSPVSLTLTTTLVLKPVKRTRIDHVNYTPPDVNAPAPRGCVAR
jgi:hypothetical protein